MPMSSRNSRTPATETVAWNSIRAALGTRPFSMQEMWWWKQRNWVPYRMHIMTYSAMHSGGGWWWPANRAGLNNNPRAAITPCTPVSSPKRRASSKVYTSPLCTTGMDRLSRTTFTDSWRTGAEDRILSVLPCTVIQLAPAASICRANSTDSRSVFRSRILTVRSMSVPAWLMICFTISLTSSGLDISAPPIPSLMAHFCGQPQLRSMASQ
mmetsp:Transcript_141432/g.246555  ORF Transcript_141432/g.246555 Transcript_141432/m.246555 type:complete len:211 (-) Transcript_141432:361-993(-)